MRGLYLLAFLALVGAATARTAFNKNDLPAHMREMSLTEIRKEVMGAAAPLAGVERSALDDALVELLEKFRAMMPVGIPAFGIPPLDPLFINKLQYNLSSDLMAVAGYIAQSTVQDLSGFITNKVKVNPIRLQVNFDLLFPAINMGGLYDIDGVLTVLPIYGTGPYTATMHNFSVVGTLDMGTRLNGSVYIKDIPLDITLESLTNNFEGLMGGGAMGQIMNDMITDMAPALVESVESQLLGPLTNLIMAKANAVLVNYTMAELIDLILNGPPARTTVAPPKF